MTTAMLDWKLRKQYTTLRPEGWKGKRKISGICLHQDEPVAKDTLQIVLSLSAPSDAFCISVVERSTQNQLAGYNGWLLICEDGKAACAVNDILSCFHQFLNWREQIRLLCAVENNLQRLMDAAEQYLNADLILIGQTQEILARSTHAVDPGKEEILNLLNTRNPKTLYLHDPEFDKTFQTDGLTRYQFGPMHNHIIYYCNIRLESIYLARILCLISPKDECSGLKQCLELVTPLICSYYRDKYTRDLQAMHNDQTRRVLRELLEGKNISEERLESLLEKRDWSAKSQYQVIVMRTARSVHSEQALNYYASQLSTTFPSFLAVGFGESIFCVRNLDQAERKDLRSALSFFLQENLFRAGVSNAFSGITDCSRYRKQAEEALDLGQREDPDLWRYDFSDYLYEYAMEKLTEDYSPEDFCPSALKRIRLYDEKKPTAQLEKTLRQYVVCRFNATEAADRLFIHRTTFLYRMNKIEQVSGLCLQNWKDMVVLMIALSAGDPENSN